ncbi:hypothetical protein Cni_G20721 [Canna indica]|uniref:Homeobox domain-containing protein n=1 Tax=Canna indica TaxID=4628 RepID=A0AAQ3KUI5_9LILI|nr:hypothetical protein Cni_G20721 [Canna indica]
MATYFHGAPEIQADGLQTLYLMNPGYVGYVDSVAPANMVLLNSTLNPVSSINLGHAGQLSHHHHQQQQQHFGRIPLQQGPQPPHDSSRPPPPSAGLHPNLWTPPTTSNSLNVASQFGLQRASSATQQGLSLSLSPHEMAPPSATNEAKIAAVVGPSNGVSDLQGVLMGSRYLKAAQQLLDEVVSVGKGIKDQPETGANSKKQVGDGGEVESKGTAAEGNMSPKGGADLTTAERQELQMKKAKLINMLDEVEQRYRQYHQQMQLVVSSFEAVAGYGSATTYTALALRTISKQFRCLRDAITGQIRATSKSLGEEDAKSSGSRLRFIDHHLRQQRALQQLGMIQQNAWRPQRGLPERSVSILRAWLFEHFLHPYPKDSDKVMLAKQTGLTRSQVSNWFINARVRLWKPMVEEMYMEEIKDQEQNNDDENASKSDANGTSSSKSSAQRETSPTTSSLKNDQKQTSAAIQSSGFPNSQNQAFYENSAIVQPMIKKTRSDDSLHMNVMPHSIGIDMKLDALNNQELLMKLMDGRQREQGYPLMAGNTSYGANYGAYGIGELGRFEAEQFNQSFSGNGVSLTLGLQHSENIAFSGAQPSYLSGENMQLGRRLGMGNEASDYCNLNNNNNNNHNTTVALSPNAAFGNERGMLMNYYRTS